MANHKSDSISPLLTDQENVVLNYLVDAWNACLLLPAERPCNTGDPHAEFRDGINRLQDLIGARPTWRSQSKRSG